MTLRQETMGKVFWEKERTVLLKQCMTKKTKQKQLIWKKINLTDAKVREAVIQAYLQRCIFRYKIRFI